MLRILVPGKELYNEKTEEFIYPKDRYLNLEHSLLSIVKWESKWHKPFISTTDKSFDEIIDYIKCMTLDPNVDPEVYLCLTNENISEINSYIDDPMSAYTYYISSKKHTGYKEIITAETIYYQMIFYNIPFECQKWHFNRLMALIKMCISENQSSEKLSDREIIERNSRLNEERRKKYNSAG